MLRQESSRNRSAFCVVWNYISAALKEVWTLWFKPPSQTAAYC